MTPNKTSELSGQVAVVTGSSGGIGRAIALELAAAGADLLIHGGHDRAMAELTSAEIAGLGRQSHFLLADFQSEQSVAEFGAAACNWRGTVDVWINNAGADILTGQNRKLQFQEKLRQLWQVDVLA